MQFIEGYISEKGNVRKSNQDSLFVIKAVKGAETILFAGVCDGMGGYQFGEVASKECTCSMVNWFRNSLPELFSGRDAKWKERVYRQWEELIQQVNKRLVDFGKRTGSSPGTTISCLLFVGDEFMAANVGDSRCYAISDSVTQITRDQSMVADRVRKGLITQEEGKNANYRNILLQCVGVNDDVEPDYYFGKIEPEMSFVICSDGFWHLIEDADLIKRLQSRSIYNKMVLQQNLTELTNMAMERGERDNVSVVGITVTANDDTERLDEPEIGDTEQLDEPKIDDTEQLDEPEIDDTGQSDEPKTGDTEQSEEPKTNDTEQSDGTEQSDEAEIGGTEPLREPEIGGTEPLREPEIADTEPLREPEIADTEPLREPEIADTEPLREPMISDTEPLNVPRIGDTEPLGGLAAGFIKNRDEIRIVEEVVITA